MDGTIARGSLIAEYGDLTLPPRTSFVQERDSLPTAQVANGTASEVGGFR
jgi:hypothetical protein